MQRHATAMDADLPSASRALDLARDVLRIEADAISALISRLDAQFSAAVHLLHACRGRVVVAGMGKSGHIARKIAATFASTGTPAFFLHPAEASHGDLGMVAGADVVVAISYSGESEELVAILPAIKRLGSRLIAFTGNPRSTLGRESDVVLDVRVDKEACPLNLAPTASTTATLALGDALAVALLDARGFTSTDFARSHPGGALGRRLLVRVADIMRGGDAMPRLPDSATLAEAILEMSRKGMGMTAAVGADGALAGIFTDGDLRRAFERGVDPRATRLHEVMNRSPRTIRPDALAAEAVKVMEETRISALLVTDGSGILAGALHMHDLLRAKVY